MIANPQIEIKSNKSPTKDQKVSELLEIKAEELREINERLDQEAKELELQISTKQKQKLLAKQPVAKQVEGIEPGEELQFYYKQKVTSEPEQKVLQSVLTVLKGVQRKYEKAESDGTLTELYQMMRGISVAEDYLGITKKEVQQQKKDDKLVGIMEIPEKELPLTKLSLTELDMRTKTLLDDGEANLHLTDFTSGQLNHVADRQHEIYCKKRAKKEEALRMPLTREQADALNIDVALQREMMRRAFEAKTVYHIGEFYLPQFGVSNDFLLSGVTIPDKVVSGLSQDEAECRARKRLFWKMKMQEHAARVLAATESIAVEIQDEAQM